MTKSVEVLETIKKHYGEEHYYNYQDMISLLSNDNIDNFEKTLHEHSGYDKAYDSSMICIHYDDNSILVVTTSSFIAK